MNDCLVVIFNHRYDDNIIKIKELYRRRFEKNRYINVMMPGSKGHAEILMSHMNFGGYMQEIHQFPFSRQEHVGKRMFQVSWKPCNPLKILMGKSIMKNIQMTFSKDVLRRTMKNTKEQSKYF